MKNKSTSRQRPGTSRQSDPDMKSEVNNPNMNTDDSRLMNHTGQTRDNTQKYAQENGHGTKGHDHKQNERENERLKNFQKNRRKGWNDIL